MVMEMGIVMVIRIEMEMRMEMVVLEIVMEMGIEMVMVMANGIVPESLVLVQIVHHVSCHTFRHWRSSASTHEQTIIGAISVKLHIEAQNPKSRH